LGDDFEAIVVGAGMAGCAAAIRLTQAGASVLLVERSPEPGAKNLSGGVLWGHDLDRILPHWWEEMPVERHVVRKRFGFLTAGRALSVKFGDPSWATPPYVAHTVLRARTDAWLTKKAEEAGATVVPSVPVEHLLWEGQRVHGILQDGAPVTAPVTILCDGANSRLSLGTPIRPADRLDWNATELGMKEVYRLPAEVIEERFQLRPGEAHVEEWVAAHLPEGVMGGGFLYTNRDTLSVGLILRIGSLYGRGAYSQEMMEQFKLHPAVAPYLAGAELVEYGAKIISSGWASRPAAFHGDGWMITGDAAGFVFSNGIVIQGMNYAVRTGLEAAETALGARAANDFSSARLAEYDQRLERTHVLHDFRDFAGMDRVKWNPRFFREYPEIATELAHRVLAGTGGPRDGLLPLFRALRREKGVGLWTLLRDGWAASREF
jgi:electron transfer flavoprotein-quinone oxidoreductase